MRSKSLIFLFVLIFMIVFSLSAVSADDTQGAFSGEVSGDVDVVTVNPWSTSGELNYEIPADAKEIKAADVYVNVYGGSAKNTHGAIANVSLNTSSGEKQLASEQLWIEDGSSDGTVYTVNDHTDKCYSDYQMHYDITDSLKGLNGSAITLKVDTFKMDNKTFDGRIKLIALILAYDDGDSDKITYFVDSTQKWTKTNTTTVFASGNVSDIVKADLINVALSSADGSFKLNGELLGDADNHSSGNYYQYNRWDVSGKVKEGQNSELFSMNTGTSTYASLKNVLSVLKLQSETITTDVSLATEYTSVNTCYAGTNNTLTIKASSSKAGKYVIELLADGAVVNSTEIELDGENQTSILLTDPTVRPVDETTVNGANNTKVTYAVNVKLNDKIVTNASKQVPLLYNGNLGKDLAYNATYIEQAGSVAVTGGVVIDIKDASSYLSAAALNRTDVWTVVLDNQSAFVKALVYVPYNWFNPNLASEDLSMFNASFNNVSVVPVALYRDQGNLGNYGRYGYGLVVYDVSELIANGENSFVLNKAAKTPAVYPSTLIYLYNTTGSKTLTTVYFADGADLLANSNNNAGRISKTDNTFDISIENIANAQLYVFAASAQANEGNIIFNGNESVNVWSGSSNSVGLFTADVTNSISTSNNVSFIATGSTILALNQIIAVTQQITSSQIKGMVIYGNGTISAVLADGNGKPISNANISYSVDGVENVTLTNGNGEFTVPVKSSCVIEINFEGTDAQLSVNTKLTLKDIAPARAATVINGNNFTQAAIEYSSGERGGNFTVQLVDAAGNVLANKTILIGYNGKTLERITDENGFAYVQINLKDANRLTFAVTFLGDEEYNATMSVYLITITKKPVIISAPAKSYNAGATKKYIVTLSTVKNADGKTYFAAGKKVTMKLDGKTYTAKTNAKGQATFALKVTKKGTLKATISYAGDTTYSSASKTAKITIK